MSFSSDQGYTPSTISDLMSLVREGVNEQFDTEYDQETFLGTNFYKYFYALIQRLQANEVKTSEIVLKLQQYFDETNELIARPNTTHPGLFDYFEARGFVVSSKAPIEAEAGELRVCVDTDEAADDYAEKKLEICEILSECVPGGIVTVGTESEDITLSNGQSFEYAFNLPDRLPVLLRLTLVTSQNNQAVILPPEETAALLALNIAARYKLGRAFEPQRYFSIVDAPWAASVLLEYSLNAGADWDSVVYDSEYDELFEFDPETDIEVVES
jgi:hypothetical protein